MIRVSHARSASGAAQVSLPGFILLATSVFLFVGLGAFAAWRFTGRQECVEIFFSGPGAFYLVALAMFEFSLARMALRQFSDGEPMRPVWFLLMLAAGCHLAGAVCTHVLSADTPLNPLARASGWSEQLAVSIRRFGTIAGGPFHLALLGGGLFCLLRFCRRTIRLARPSITDGILLAAAGVYTCRELFQLRPATAYAFLAASNGPLVAIVLIEAVLIRRSMISMGGGLIARCWNSFAAAMLVTLLANLGLWGIGHGYLPPAFNGLVENFTFLSATAFALGPAWQVQAIQSAGGEIAVPRFSPVVSSLSALRLLNR